MSGGKGGSTSSTVTIPQYIEDAAKANLAKAEEISKIGYTPYYGPDVAAFTPMQQAGFQNTAGMADAFGLAGGGTGMEGMPTPTTYAGGIQGYSSAPMFEQSMAELEARRPGQYAAINAPFIDPVTGAQPLTPYGTGGADAAAAAGAGYASGTDYTQASGGSDNTGAMTVDEQMAMFPTATVNGSSPGLSSGTFLGGGADNQGNFGAIGDFAGGITDAAGITNYSGNQPDLPGNVVSRALNIGAGAKNDDGGYSGSSNDGCVVATHAVNSGAFSPATKREAVVWCMNALHGKWWGEAVRRGYRYCGNKKIEQGKAREHYGEFRRYIDFASGKKRTLRGALTFTFRTAQFFAVGLVKKDA
jgi:hypothetical protein